MVVDHILDSAVPSNYFSVESWNIPPSIRLADPHFNVPAPVDLLLDLNVFWAALGTKKCRLDATVPDFRESEFGWIVAGSLKRTDQIENKFVFCVQQDNDSLLKSMERFWIVESCENLTVPLNKEERECERIFTETTFQRADGRFVVTLPFKIPASELGDSRNQALKRFTYLENRLMRNSDFRQQYVACMQEYISLGHMREITILKNNKPSCYIAHHAVIKKFSTSTKLRVVFDASMKTTSGLSLNDILMTGPTVQPELFSTLLRFRTYKYCFVADITKMYRMIRIHPDCAPLQRIFWRDHPDKELKTYQLETVTFGTKPAPFLATRCLKELALRFGEIYPSAKSVLMNDFYVDDVLSGADSIEAAQNIQKELRELLERAGFQLSKWCANKQSILSGICNEHIEKQFPLSLDAKRVIKTLGVLWLPNEDLFQIRFNNDKNIEPVTKRQVLSEISGYYDILGLYGPIIVYAKHLMQSIWRLEREKEDYVVKACDENKTVKGHPYYWDDILPEEVLSTWREFRQQLILLNNLSIPRFISYTKAHKYFELHGFSDASSRAYGAVVYCRVVDNAGEVNVHLLCSKSRIAPLKQLSIPRLELCAAVLLAELIHKVRAILALNVKVDFIKLWSDSQVTLSWLASESLKWSVFVAHRVSRVQSLTSDCVWDYVESEVNPADILSKGTLPKNFVDADIWFNGPDFLRSHNKSWSTSVNFKPDKSVNLERKAQVFITQVQQTFLFSLVNEPMTGRLSTEFVSFQGFAKLIKMTALFLRFINNCRRADRVITKDRVVILSANERRNAKIVIIKLVQREYFAQEIRALKSRGELPNNSKISSLSPFLDRENVLRVEGRIAQSLLSANEVNPFLLPSKHKLARLIVWHYHLTELHAGPRFLKSLIRREFWITGLQNLVKKCILSCHTCVTLKAKAQVQVMAQLPRERVVPSPPFHHTGVDYAGPFMVSSMIGRRKTQVKAYVAVFVCFSTKAVHLELVSDLTTPKFLSALTRFISRRARSATINSDNGTTFVGANNALRKLRSSLERNAKVHAANELKELYNFLEENEQSISDFTGAKGIEWHFIPPGAPHFGGLWEAAVKSTKNHMKSVLRDKSFNYEELTTLLVQIEACLNSRPLTPESSDPDDLNALTPGHFLVGGPLTALPCESFVGSPENRLRQYQRREQAVQLFWKRWSTEYLHTLQQRTKWRFAKDEIKENDFVLLRDENLPPMSWKKGRIHKLHKGTDGRNRVATVRTQTGLFKRPLVKLVYLPVE